MATKIAYALLAEKRKYAEKAGGDPRGPGDIGEGLYLRQENGSELPQRAGR